MVMGAMVLSLGAVVRSHVEHESGRRLAAAGSATPTAFSEETASAFAERLDDGILAEKERREKEPSWRSSSPQIASSLVQIKHPFLSSTIFGTTSVSFDDAGVNSIAAASEQAPLADHDGSDVAALDAASATQAQSSGTATQQHPSLCG